MEFPFEYPFPSFNLNKTIEIERKINEYLRSNLIESVCFNYNRIDTKSWTGAIVVEFDFWFSTISKEEKENTIVILSKISKDKLFELIEYSETLSKKHQIKLINKFHDDGYSYDRRDIKRIITSPNNV